MASIEHIDVETGATIYMIVEKVSDNTVRDVVAHDWDTYAVADLINGDYSVTVDETPDDSYRYLATFPTVAAGDYLVKFYRRAGGAPAVADLLVGSGTVHWSGTAISPVLNTGIVNVANGTVEADATYVMGTILTEGAGGQLAGGVIKFFDKASPTGTVNSLPDKVAGATDGLFIAGTNAATTITSAGGNALTLSSTGSNGAGLVVLGNGTGSGFYAEGGAVAPGIKAKGGTTSGAGFYASATANNDAGMELVKHGTGSDIDADALAAISDDWTDGGRLDLLLDALPTTGSGAVAVDHDYGGAGTLTVKTGGGVGIDGVTIQAYTKANWDAGNVSSAYIVAETTTDVNGEFESPLMLDAGTTYTLNYFLQGEYGANQEEVTVT